MEENPNTEMSKCFNTLKKLLFEKFCFPSEKENTSFDMLLLISTHFPVTMPVASEETTNECIVLLSLIRKVTLE